MFLRKRWDGYRSRAPFGKWKTHVAGAGLLCLAITLIGSPDVGASGAASRSTMKIARGSRSKTWTQLGKLPIAARGPVSLALGAAKRSYRIATAPEGFQASNSRQRLHAHFDGGGLQLSSGKAWLGLSSSALVEGAATTALGKVRPRLQGSRVVYSRSGLSEWYSNGPLGVEQGFAVAAPPTAAGAGPLTISMALSGDTHATAASDGQSVRLATRGGPTLRYGGVVATDAAGHRLTSSLKVDAGYLLLSVEARGAQYPLRIDPVIEQAELSGGTEEVGEGEVGSSVALSEDGSTMLVAGETDNSEVGAVWVFVRSGSTWSQQGEKLTGGGEEGAGRFGDSVALSADGNTALIGGEWDSSRVGAAWVFTRSGATWSQQGEKLTGGGETGEGDFGSSVALSADGNTALIGGSKDDPKFHEIQGAAWVFTRSGATWTQQGEKLTGGEETAEKESAFGSSVALSANGNVALIGAPEDSWPFWKQEGSVFVFKRSGSEWARNEKLTVPDEREGGYQLGSSVALSADGGTALIGAPKWGPPFGGEPGAAWVFTDSGFGWSEQGKLTGLGETGNGKVGRSVALSADGNTALVGGSNDGPGTRGSAWTYVRDGGSWYQRGEKFKAAETVGAGHFGSSVAMSAEGDFSVIGEPGAAVHAGAAWAFTYEFSPDEGLFATGNPAEPYRPHCLIAKPVNCATGNETESQSDLTVGGRGPGLKLTRSYNSQLAVTQGKIIPAAPGLFGYGWTGSYSGHLTLSGGSKVATIHQDNGSAVKFDENVSKEWVPGSLVQATLVKEGSNYVFTLPDRTQLTFDSAGRLAGEADRNGITVALHRNGEGRLESISDAAEREITLKYNGGGQIESATDPMGHTVKYTYESGDLATVTEPGEGSPRWKFKYDSSHQLTSETDGRGHTTTLQYNGSHTVIAETDPLGNKRHWKYEATASGSKTTIAEPNGALTVERFNDAGLPTSVTHASGTASTSTTTSEYDVHDNLKAVKNPDGRVTKYGYDESGNRTSQTDPLGNETKWTYNEAHQVLTSTGPSGETTTTTRDSHGNPEAISRPAPEEATQTATYNYDESGDVESVTDPRGHTTTYEYDGYGDKAAETDPEGDKHTWTYNEDSQDIAAVAPRGNVEGGEPSKYTTTIERDAQGRPVAVSEPESARQEGSPPDPPVNTEASEISGNTQEGQTLTASTGSWGGTAPFSYAYQWQSCNALGVSCLDIPGATGSTYAATSGDVGQRLRAVVTATNAADREASTSEASATIAAALPHAHFSSEFGSEGSGAGQFSRPGGIAIDGSGDLWVIDGENNRLEKFNPAGEFLTSVGSEGSEPGQLLGPTAVAIDSEGNLWVADAGNARIEEFDREGEYVKVIGAAGAPHEYEEVSYAEGVAVDSHDNVWVSATYQGRLVVFSNGGEYLKSVASPGSEPGQLEEPEGVAIDSNNHVWVAEWANDRISEFNEAGEYLRAVGSEGSGDGQFRLPFGIATDVSDNVWVTDISNQRVQEFDKDGEYLQQFGSEGIEPGQFELQFPAGLAIDASGNTWVADTGNYRIQKWNSSIAPSNLALPNIAHPAVEGVTLQAVAGSWEGAPIPTYSYQWVRCSEAGSECLSIEGATASSYLVKAGDMGKTLKVTVTAANSAGLASASSATTAAVVASAAPANTAPPAISGTLQQERTLSASFGAWTGTPTPSYAYQWRRCDSSGESCANITAATGSTYVAGHEDIGKTLRVKVTATNAAGSVAASSDATTTIAPLKRITKYAYDANGNRETVTDPFGHATTYTYDADDEPTRTEAPSGTVTETEYDSEGRVVEQVDGAKHATKYTRNLLGRVTAVKDPLERTTTREYDAAGNLTKVTDAASRKTTYTYDQANRLDEIDYSEEATPDVKYEYDVDGNRTKMIDGSGESVLNYDQLDRLTKHKDGHGSTVSYKYNLDNQPTTITYPGSKDLTRTYDEAGRLDTVTDWLEHATQFSYDPDSNLTATKYPAGTGGEDTYTYDAHDQMTEVSMAEGEETLASITYTHDSNGRPMSAAATGLPGQPDTLYRYDANGRLTKASAVSYRYDAADNPTGIGSATYSYDNASQLEKGGGNTYTYDELGERTKATPTTGPATSYGYDQAGNLTSVKRTEEGSTPAINDAYTYDGKGQRASEDINGSTHYLAWDTGAQLPLILSDGIYSYVYGAGDIPVEQIDGEGHVLYLHHDHQASTRMLTSPTGTIEGTTTYDPYGNAIAHAGEATSLLGYAGEYTAADTGLLDLRARSYDPVTAQFPSVDPISALTRNPYGYTKGSPLSERDPTGLLSWSDIGQVVGVAAVCVLTDGAGCVAAGLADLDANVVANDIHAVLNPCQATRDEEKSLHQLLGFGLTSGVGQLSSLTPEIKIALERIPGGGFAAEQLKALGVSAGTLTGLVYAEHHPVDNSSCNCSA